MEKQNFTDVTTELFASIFSKCKLRSYLILYPVMAVNLLFSGIKDDIHVVLGILPQTTPIPQHTHKKGKQNFADGVKQQNCLPQSRTVEVDWGHLSDDISCRLSLVTSHLTLTS